MWFGSISHFFFYIVPTTEEYCVAENIESTNPTCSETPAIIAGVVAIVLIVAMTAILIVVLFLRNRLTQYITTKKRFVYK